MSIGYYFLFFVVATCSISLPLLHITRLTSTRQFLATQRPCGTVHLGYTEYIFFFQDLRFLFFCCVRKKISFLMWLLLVHFGDLLQLKSILVFLSLHVWVLYFY